MSRLSLTIVGLGLVFVSTTPATAGGDSELLGLGLGAVAGGVIGNQFGHGAGRVATTAAGIFAGGYVGDELGRNLNQPDAYGSAGPVTYAAPPFDIEAYSTPNYVAPPAPEPSAIYMGNAANVTCRRFPQQPDTSYASEVSYGLACLQPDGSWRIAP